MYTCMALDFVLGVFVDLGDGCFEIDCGFFSAGAPKRIGLICFDVFGAEEGGAMILEELLEFFDGPFLFLMFGCGSSLT